MSPATVRIPRPGPISGRVQGRVARRAALGVSGLLVLVVAVAWLLLGSPWLRLQRLEFRGDMGPAQQRAVAHAVAAPLGQPLVQVDTDAIARRVIDLGTVAHVDVARALPSGLVVTVEPRQPVLAVPGDQGRFVVVDRDGLPFSVVSKAPAGVPISRVARAGNADDLKTLAAVVGSVSADQRAVMSGLAVDDHGWASFRLDRVRVRWGSAERGDLKARIVTVLAARPGVKEIDVVAPDQPVTRP